MKNQQPPKWAPWAIATPRGWTHPKTGEILVSRRDLILPITSVKNTNSEESSIELTIPDSSEKEVETVPKRRAGRPKKKLS